MISKEAVLHILSGIQDPELKRSLTELDMVKSVEINGGDVVVGITLTVPGCPLKAKINDDVTRGVGLIPGVESVRVVFDVMTDQQREKLKAQLGIGGREAVSIVNFAKRFIAVTSGKGGVGKSTVTVNLAAALARKGHMVGLLDADVYGFSIPRMLGVSGQPTIIDDKIVPLRKGDNLQVVSMGFFVHEDDPVIWRGPLLHKAINQFLTDVVWDDLDFLLLDLPPGTGDVTLTIAQSIPAAELLVVTTPQATATHVAGRVAKLAARTNLKVIGVIENMSYFENNGHREYIFGQGGGQELAKRLGVQFLGEIPLSTSIREGGDLGKPAAIDGSPQQIAMFEQLASAIETKQQG
ncbi:sodium:proton antiporter [candidate division GN15 bacterium]|uniref:Iron-sulfur cluster carrier protein n=1 Tax=candidate division GN15 bacterium TaxID=2072418 RepID=A0A855X386_9BACT|nr:MAG: sodium:proton antiporter [candidate division GN15 bacterium]